MPKSLMYYNIYIFKKHKNPIKDRWPDPSQGRQKGKANIYSYSQGVGYYFDPFWS